VFRRHLNRSIVYSANQINQSLPGDLLANIQESLTVYADKERGRAIRSDVNVSQQTEFPTALANASAVALAEPTLVKRPPHLTRHIDQAALRPAGWIVAAAFS